jgi:O-antigen/teichoic acid export membrane protein
MAASILAKNQQAKRTVVQAVAAGFNIISNLLVATWIGINGVAWVYVLTEVILLVGYSWIVWRKW